MPKDLIFARRKVDNHARKDLYNFVIDLKGSGTRRACVSVPYVLRLPSSCQLVLASH
jgi:hypothetical protein